MQADGLDEVARYGARIETLRELAMLADAGLHLSGDGLREMALECERATTPVSEIDLTCPTCRGTGGGRYNDCPTCGGNGVV